MIEWKAIERAQQEADNRDNSKDGLQREVELVNVDINEIENDDIESWTSVSSHSSETRKMKFQEIRK